MQLNNTNGKVIIIDEIFVTRNRIDYIEYEYGGSSNGVKKTHFFSTVVLKNRLTELTNFQELCYNILAMELGNYWIVSEDTQNWVIDLGSTGEPSIIRVYVPASILNEVMHTGNELDVLLKAMAPLAPQVLRLESGAHQYLIELLDEHKAILETYPGIIIENRII
jgi:hypothetical protein